MYVLCFRCCCFLFECSYCRMQTTHTTLHRQLPFNLIFSSVQFKYMWNIVRTYLMDSLSSHPCGSSFVHPSNQSPYLLYCDRVFDLICVLHVIRLTVLSTDIRYTLKSFACRFICVCVCVPTLYTIIIEEMRGKRDTFFIAIIFFTCNNHTIDLMSSHL